jgi:hypothetical protein
MRYVPLHEHLPDADWLEKAHTALEDLQAAPDVESRNLLIDRNAHVWGELKSWLLSLSHNKCWISETHFGYSHPEVEHFRPKKTARNLDGSSCDGYWWLAFEWRNFRVCGSVGNRKKGTYFPLRDGSERAGVNSDLRCEVPLLLDPTDPHDPGLLFFSLEGLAVVEPKVCNEWERKRTEYSIDRYNLNFELLVDKRKAVWSDCWTHIRRYLAQLELLDTNPDNTIARESMRDAATRILQLMRADQELSAVSRACLESSGDPRLGALLRSV